MAYSGVEVENLLNESIAVYFKEHVDKNYSLHASKDIGFDELLNDKMLIVSAIRTGIPYSLFKLIQKYSSFSEGNWATFLSISQKSLQRYRKDPDHFFKSIHAEKIIGIAEVIRIGLDVFGNIEKLKLWLNSPNYALGKVKPIELIKDSYGRELVTNELIRIDHGILV